MFHRACVDAVLFRIRTTARCATTFCRQFRIICAPDRGFNFKRAATRRTRTFFFVRFLIAARALLKTIAACAALFFREVALTWMEIILFAIDENGRFEIALRFGSQFRAKLILQNAGFDFFNCAFFQIAQLERAEGDADEAVHLQAEMFKNALHFAVLAFAQAQGQPDIVALFALQFSIDRAIAHTVDFNAAFERIKIGLRDIAISANAITAQPACVRQRDHTCEPAIIGEEQQAFRVDVETADCDNARQALR